MTKIVISLTSYPARINTVNQVIESLFAQQQKADEIVLWLSSLEFPNKYLDLPDNLNNLIGKEGFRVEWVKENIKSHKKYFYALQERENITITVDDDMYYSDTMVSTLIDSYKLHPHAVSARNIHIMMREEKSISPYLSWEAVASEYIGEERVDLCAIGVGGILYPPGCADEKWFNKDAIIECAENQDDLWLKYNEIIDGIPVVYTGMNGKDLLIEGSQCAALHLKNAHGGDNDICIKRLLNKLLKNHRALYETWFESLMEIEEVLLIKRKYYSNKLDKILGDRNNQDIYICGAGKYAHVLYDFIKSCGKEQYIKAFLVTQSTENMFEHNEVEIKNIKDLDRQEAFNVICGVSKKYEKELKEALEVYEFHEWIEIDILAIKRLLQLENSENKEIL